MTLYQPTLALLSILTLSACTALQPVMETDVLYQQTMTQAPYQIRMQQPVAGRIFCYPLQMDLEQMLPGPDGEETELQVYLKQALPEIEQHFSKQVPLCEAIAPLPLTPAKHRSEITNYRADQATEPLLHMSDLATVHFGDPAYVIEHYNFQYQPEHNNQLTLVNGSAKWRQQFQQAYSEKSAKMSRLLDIRIGLIQVTPTWKAKHSLITTKHKVHWLGTDYALEDQTGAETAINVIAFKGLSYDRKGVIIKAAVEGVIPLYPSQGDLGLSEFFQGESVNYRQESTADLNPFTDAPWQQALDKLVFYLTAP